MTSNYFDTREACSCHFLLIKAPDIDSETDSESDRRNLKRSSFSKVMESWFLSPFQNQLTKMITSKFDVHKCSQEKGKMGAFAYNVRKYSHFILDFLGAFA